MSETYTIQPGDSLSKIAREHGVSLGALIKANPQINNPNLIRPGLVIEIPRKTLKKAKTKVFPNKTYTATVYVVKPGDYLSKIAADNGISLKDLLKANPKLRLRKNLSLIFPGEKIVIPSKTASTETEKEAATRKPDKKTELEQEPRIKTPKIHTIAAGETLYGIARRYGISYKALINANPQIKNPNIIHIGDEIKIPSGTIVEAQKKEEKTAETGSSKPVATSRAKPAKVKARDLFGVSGAEPQIANINGHDRFGHNIALTFDDGPNLINTPKVLDILKDNGIKAVFFIKGEALDACYKANPGETKKLLQRMIKEGHILGNHTYTHPNAVHKTEEEIKDELSKTQALLNKILGKEYRLTKFRSPGGHWNHGVVSAVESKGITQFILWNIDSSDYKKNIDKNRKPQDLENEVLKELKNRNGDGGVILFHDLYPHCVEPVDGKDPESQPILEKIIKNLKDKGYNFKTVDELMEIKSRNAKKKKA